MAINPDYLSLIERTPVNNALDYGFVAQELKKLIKKHYPFVSRIEHISHKTYKRRVGRTHSTFIYGYSIRGHRKDGRLFEKNIIYSAHTDNSRKKAFEIMEHLIDLGFNEGHNRVIEPLVYREDLHALIYEAVPGKNLLQYMQAHTPRTDLDSIIRRAATWIKKFHSLSVPLKKRSAFPIFDYHDLNIDLPNLIQKTYEANKQQGEKLEAFLRAMDDVQAHVNKSVEPGLVYGDFHPENIITDDPHALGLTMIDLVDVSFGDQLRDVGSFLQQLHFMGREYYDAETVAHLRMLFLKFYFDSEYSQIPTQCIQRINMYQAWNALRGFVWFFLQHEQRDESYGMLEDAWLYITLAIDNSHEITIHS